ncbi:MAG TPA: hypothetical protein VFM18_13410, partial [Methanosarcina sp.]|nr:hypothetical protein [Methanosarcina sp.]
LRKTTLMPVLQTIAEVVFSAARETVEDNTFCESCGGNDETPQDHCTDCVTQVEQEGGLWMHEDTYHLALSERPVDNGRYPVVKLSSYEDKTKYIRLVPSPSGSSNQIHHTVRGWTFSRNADGSIGIHSPLPRPGESQRTSHVVYKSQNADLHELLGKLADHQSKELRSPFAPAYEGADIYGIKDKYSPESAITVLEAECTLRDSLIQILRADIKELKESLKQKAEDDNSVDLLMALQDAWPYVHQHCTIQTVRNKIAGLLFSHNVPSIEKCDLPPAGWSCSRGKGHLGPCAASPIFEDEAELGVMK